MKRLETLEEKDKKTKRKQIIIGVILAAILLVSTAAYAFTSIFGGGNKSSTNKVNYNGLVFYKNGELWQMDVSGKSFLFSYLPNETRQISLNKTLQDYYGKPLYFTESTLAGQEIARNIEQFAEKVRFACLEGDNCTQDWPIKNCASNIVIIEEKDFSVITSEGNCTYILSNDTTRDADAFLYRIFGIK